MRRIVIIGGVAAGMSAAAQAKRRDPEAEVIVFERGPNISYGACGIPYNLENPQRAVDDLVVLSVEAARRDRGIDVRTEHDVTAIDAERRLVHVRVGDGRVHEVPYDALVLATGASPSRPPIAGLDSPGVFFVRDLVDAKQIKEHLAHQRSERAIVIGGGYIGLEMSEALTAYGLSVTLLEGSPQLLPSFETSIARLAREELERHGVVVHTSVEVRAIRAGEAPRRLVVETAARVFAADLVVVATGVRPNVALARDAGVALGETGAIAVDAYQRTNLPDVYAAGDCAEAYHRILERPAYIPLGTTANKQGKVAGANAVGGSERFAGIVGTAGFKLFDVQVARTGLGLADCRASGIDAVALGSRQRSRGHGYPGGGWVTTVLIIDPASGRLLGGQMLGEGSALRIDVLAAALQAGMGITELEQLDLAYAPPFAPVYDPLLIAANVAAKQLRLAR